MAKVMILLADGFEEIEAVGVIDVLRRAGVEVCMVCIDRVEFVKGAHDIYIKSDIFVEDVKIDEYDMVILPGGWSGTMALAKSEKVKDILKTFKKTKMIGAICAAPFVLKEAGVLNTKYTAYPSVVAKIDTDGYIEQKVVEDENIITSQGPGTSVCFALSIVKRLVGANKAEEIKKEMLLGYCENI